MLHDATWCFHLDPRTIEKWWKLLWQIFGKNVAQKCAAISHLSFLLFPIHHLWGFFFLNGMVLVENWHEKSHGVWWMFQIGGPSRICKFHSSLPVRSERLVDPMTPVEAMANCQFMSVPQSNMAIENVKFPFKHPLSWVMFHCHLWLPEGKSNPMSLKSLLLIGKRQ